MNAVTPPSLETAPRGAAVGAVFGACMVAASLGVSKGIVAPRMGIPSDPLNGVTLGLAVWTLAVSALLGGALTEVLRRALPRRPGLLVYVLPAPFVALALRSATYPLAQVGAVGLAWLVLLALRAGWRRWPRTTLGLGFVPVVAGFAAALWPVAAPPRVTSAAAHGGGPNVLWVIFDTVRADHLPTGGYGRDTAPRLAALAAEGVTFERAYAPAPWTLPSHAAMLTGTYPDRNGCHDQHLFLDSALPTAAELLGRSGWDSALLASNVWVGDATGLSRGFDRTVAAWRASLEGGWFPAAELLRPWLAQDKGGAAVDAAFEAWLDARSPDRPFFAFVNYLESHVPYDEIAPADREVFVPDEDAAASKAASARYNRFLNLAPEGPGPSAEDLEALVSLYDAGIRSDDRHLGALLDLLDARGLLDNTLVIVTSDHGEALGEEGRWEHHNLPSEAVLRVPLIIRFPARLSAGARVGIPVSLVDLLPTMLDAVGLGAQIPEAVQGRSLLPMARGEIVEDLPVYSEGFPPESPIQRARVAALGLDPGSFRWRSVQLGALRLVRGPEGEHLYDGFADPGWTREIQAQTPEAAEALGALLDAHGEGAPAAGGAVPSLDDAAREQLRHLGYLE